MANKNIDKAKGRVKEALGALSLELSAEQLAALTTAVPPNAAAGGRYPAAAMEHLDSER